MADVIDALPTAAATDAEVEGKKLEDQGRFREAAESFGRAAELWHACRVPPDEAEAQLAEARSLRNQAIMLHRAAEQETADAETRAATLEVAKQTAEAACEVGPSYAPARRTLGLVLLSQKRQPEALAAFQRAKELGSTDAANLQNIGQIQLEMGDLQSASDTLRSAIESSSTPTDRKFALRSFARLLDRQAEALDGKGEGDAARSKRNEAIARLQEAVDADRNDPSSHNQLGLERKAAGDLAGAVESFRAADELWRAAGSANRKFALRNWADTLTALAEAAAKQGKAEETKHNRSEAIGRLDEAAKADPDDPSTYNQRGLLRQANAEFAAALEDFRIAAEHWERAGSPDRKFALRNWADTLLAAADAASKQGKPGEALAYRREAVAQLREAFKVDSEGPETAQDPDTLNGYGAALVALGDYLGAISCFHRAAALWSKSGSATQEVALRNEALALIQSPPIATDELVAALRLDSGDAPRSASELAAKTLRQALSLNGNDPELHNLLGAALSETPDDAEAIKAFSMAVRLCDGAKERKYALRNWAGILARRGEAEEAAAKLEEAVRADGDDADSRFSYGNALSEIGQQAKALEQFEKAIQLDQTAVYARYNRALGLFRDGRYEDGWIEWEATHGAFSQQLKPARDILETGTLEQSPEAKPLAEKAAYFGFMLLYVYADLEPAEQQFDLALRLQPGLPLALAGLAILHRRKADSERCESDTPFKARAAMQRALEALQDEGATGAAAVSRPDLGRCVNILALANLHIEDRNWPAANELLDRAEQCAGVSAARRIDIHDRRGLICLLQNQFAEAARHFQRALFEGAIGTETGVKLAYALLQNENSRSAQREFEKVLKRAPGHIEALMGDAAAAFELAEDGDRKSYERAHRRLSEVLEHGKENRSGSQLLRERQLANVYYLRGVVCARWVAGPGAMDTKLTLDDAKADFRQCLRFDKDHERARGDLESLGPPEARQIARTLDAYGPAVICGAGLLVAALAQPIFLFSPADKFNQTSYLAATFGGLLFVVAGLSLPSLLKLQVVGITLEKAKTPEAATPKPALLAALSHADLHALLPRLSAAPAYPTLPPRARTNKSDASSPPKEVSRREVDKTGASGAA